LSRAAHLHPALALIGVGLLVMGGVPESHLMLANDATTQTAAHAQHYSTKILLCQDP